MESGILVLRHLYSTDNIYKVYYELDGYTRAGAQRVVDRFVRLGILEYKNKEETYDRAYIYRKYMNIFIK